MKIGKSTILIGLALAGSVLIADAKRDKSADSMKADLSAIDNISAAATATTMSLTKCPKCQNNMEQGFLLDERGPLPTADTVWAQGTVRHRTKITRHIEAYRCIGCGFLELYAKQP